MLAFEAADAAAQEAFTSRPPPPHANIPFSRLARASPVLLGARFVTQQGQSLNDYLHTIEQQTGQLIGNTCQCSAILSGHEVNSSIAQACKIFGEELAMAQQLIFEADEMSDLLKKCRRAPRKWPLTLPVTVPLLRAAEIYPQLKPIIRRGFADERDAAAAIALIDQSDAVDHALKLATNHANDAADALELLPNSATRSALLVLCHKILAGVPLK